MSSPDLFWTQNWDLSKYSRYPWFLWLSLISRLLRFLLVIFPSFLRRIHKDNGGWLNFTKHSSSSTFNSTWAISQLNILDHNTNEQEQKCAIRSWFSHKNKVLRRKMWILFLSPVSFQIFKPLDASAHINILDQNFDLYKHKYTIHEQE